MKKETHKPPERIEPELSITTIKIDPELHTLGRIVNEFESLSEEAKFRTMWYLSDRYSKYMPNKNY